MILDDIVSLIKVSTSGDTYQVVRGRNNYYRSDLGTDYCVVDILSSDSISNSSSFDGDLEIQKFTIQLRSILTIDFFGNNSRANAYSLIGKLKTNESYFKQKELNIKLMNVSRVNYIMPLEEQRYQERHQIEVTLIHQEQQEISTKRYDSAELLFLVNE